MIDLLDQSSSSQILLIALILDALIGDAAWLYTRISHPVTWIGSMITWGDQHGNLTTKTDTQRRLLGVLTILLICLITAGIASLIVVISHVLPMGWLLLSVVLSVFLAQRSLYEHVKDVADRLETHGLKAGRAAVAHIVGRDTSCLDAAGVTRASIESCAENFSDAIVAPVFWYMIAGLPGLIVYKTINTADSMIGYRSSHYQAFGWATARLDDVANFIPSRLASILLGLATFLIVKDIHHTAAWSVTWRESYAHPSPNAGWPQATMAGALGIALAGPRRYASYVVEEAWINTQASPIATIAHIRLALRLMVRATAVLWFGVISHLIWSLI